MVLDKFRLQIKLKDRNVIVFLFYYFFSTRAVTATIAIGTLFGENEIETVSTKQQISFDPVDI